MAARRRKKRTLKPRTPSRIRKRTKRRSGSRQHHELVGLGLAGFGLFLASIIWLGWSGGLVGGGIADGVRAVVGAASYAAPLVLIGLGCLMVTRSEALRRAPVPHPGARGDDSGRSC